MDIQELIQKVLNKETEYYDRIIKLYYTEIYHYVMKQVSDSEMCKELCQDIFFEAYRHLKSYNAKKSSFRTWLYKIANHTCIDYFRSKSYQQRQHTFLQDEFDMQSTQDETLKQLINNEETKKISELMHTVLKPKHERIMRYHFFADLSVSEISSIEKIPAKTVYSVIERSLDKIRQALGVRSHD